VVSQAPGFAVPVIGFPAMSVPMGTTHDKGFEIPTGVQILGRRFREDQVMDAAAVLESAHPTRTPINPR
jgi:amidase